MYRSLDSNDSVTITIETAEETFRKEEGAREGFPFCSNIKRDGWQDKIIKYTKIMKHSSNKLRISINAKLDE